MALGRGLGAILADVEDAYEKDLSSIDNFELEADGARIEHLDVDIITANPFQPRKYFDEQALKELGESISRNGLLQPIVVIEKDDGYLLIAGERRLRAHKLENIDTIKAIIADVDIDDIKLRELALLENIQRENLNAIELATSYNELLEVHQITHDELSSIVHKSRSQITNTLRLLSLSDYVQDQLVLEKVSQGHAKVLVGLDDKKQRVVIDSIIGQKLSVRDTENMVKSYKEKLNPTASPKVKVPTFLAEYKEEFSKVLSYDFKLKNKSIEITFKNEDEIESFLAFFKSGNRDRPTTLLKRILK